MSKIPQYGSGTVDTFFPNLSFHLNGREARVDFTQKVPVRVSYEYELEIKPTEDEPGCPEYFAVNSILLLDNITACKDAIFISIASGTNLDDLISDDTFFEFESYLLKQMKEGRKESFDETRVDRDSF